MLINLSNHPVAGVFDPVTGSMLNKWSDEQKQAAESEFDMISDLIFPEIPADASYEDVDHLADEYLEECKNALAGHSSYRSGVFLSGELVFCAVLSRKLLDNGIRTVCATSERVNTDIGDGRFIKVFRFVRFRDYGPVKGADTLL